MNNKRKKMIAGNWKMNGVLASLDEIKAIRDSNKNVYCDVVICPPTTLLMEAKRIVRDSFINIGAQNCHHNNSGAHTGEVSSSMLADIGINTVILGHSERRTNNFETTALINKKIQASHSSNLTTIVCVGESELDRTNGQTKQIIQDQVMDSLPLSANEINTVIAYEPIWAIGTGKVPSAIEIMEIHKFIRSLIKKITNQSTAKKMRILYGGSVSTKNCSELLNLTDVDGALVGGASLLASDFNRIISAVKKQ